MYKINFKNILKKKGKTMTWLHEQTKISKNTLSLISNNSSKGIQFDTLEKICLTLDITPNDLIIIKEDSYDITVLSETFDESTQTHYILGEYIPISKMEKMINSGEMTLANDPWFIVKYPENLKNDTLIYIEVSMPSKAELDKINLGFITGITDQRNKEFFQSLDEIEIYYFIEQIFDFIILKRIGLTNDQIIVGLKNKPESDSRTAFVFEKNDNGNYVLN
ncbi:helix-turn-helix domain-containing protein [Enterococcus faecium]|uniref:helix-turn-helix domain-containing protein n=1 Tax=Enterococcus faecium TaxID=1352 RepID=UPI0010C1ACFE|nr:helix-turn-helix transcriptional regulator [Enterococcus faecium]TKN84873.1 XRE family transcriptional regulator [Enterococcus faecium]